ncbi:hypothetical protein [Jannaschia sp. M317]|uniref:hypothetical protein n=1 Tax=Jannaschia sp. M317 TaxID=2867011 RepID=UPI0021A44281|nr:hypothetical protein [Jannaschia sp. M317]UWQ19396.1 hypothetical protein K3551_09105 [Jannaschia sp. M317]
MTDRPRKSAQEARLDHLLEEEFACDPEFLPRILAHLGLPTGGPVQEVVAQPSMKGNGFGDLLVRYPCGEAVHALLIENKISAAGGTRQDERYRLWADQGEAEGDWDEARTVLCAPAAYGGQAEGFDHTLTLEDMRDLLDPSDPQRLSYRQAFLDRAIDKQASSGVKVPDPATRALRQAVSNAVQAAFADAPLRLSLPRLNAAHYDGDNWFIVILPDYPGYELHWRFWTSARARCGAVLLIAPPGSGPFAPCAGAEPVTYGKLERPALTISVPEMHQRPGFDPTTASAATAAMRRLLSRLPPAC